MQNLFCYLLVSGYNAVISTFLFLVMMEVLFIANNKGNQPINDQIKAREVLVIGPNGEQVGVKSIQDALTLASYANLDLVLMSPNANPPVCKVMDYNKYRYEKKLVHCVQCQKALPRFGRKGINILYIYGVSRPIIKLDYTCLNVVNGNGGLLFPCDCPLFSLPSRKKHLFKSK